MSTRRPPLKYRFYRWNYKVLWAISKFIEFTIAWPIFHGFTRLARLFSNAAFYFELRMTGIRVRAQIARRNAKINGADESPPAPQSTGDFTSHEPP